MERGKNKYFLAFPPGSSSLIKVHIVIFVILNALALLYSMLFWTSSNYYFDMLFTETGAVRTDMIDAVLPFLEFDEIFYGGDIMRRDFGFFVAAVVMFIMIFFYYRQYKGQSMSIYLMKRTKSAGRFYMSVLTLPVLSALICLLNGAIVRFVYEALFNARMLVFYMKAF